MPATLPPDFEQATLERLGRDEYDRLAHALTLPAPTSLRLNTRKAQADELSHLGEMTPVPWCDTGFYLSQRPSFTADPLFHAGCYYVQEASSMFLAHVLKHYVTQPVTALDLCAAPGGKSTLALSMLPEDSVLIANEPVRHRANILAENIIKWGSPNSIVTNNYAADFHAFTHHFDLIVCDAPCSGEGMFRKDPASVDEWSLANVANCAERQREIVSDIWHTLKPGGLLIYSTCTYNPHENEENVQWIARQLGAEVLPCHPDPAWGLAQTDTHFYPHRNKGEGLFISVLRKAEDDAPPSAPHRTRRAGGERYRAALSKERTQRTNRIGERMQSQASLVRADALKDWICPSFPLTILGGGAVPFLAFPASHLSTLALARTTLRVVHAGTEIATVKGKDLKPCHSLAMSLAFNREAFPHIEVDAPQALSFLRAESIQLPPGTSLGHLVITHRGKPLGFVKNIGNRANNLYPSEWRIRTSGIESIF